MNQSELQNALEQAQALRITANAFIFALSSAVNVKHAPYLKETGKGETGITLEFLGNEIFIFAFVLFAQPKISIKVKLGNQILTEATMDANGSVTHSSQNIRTTEAAADEILMEMFTAMKLLGTPVFR